MALVKANLKVKILALLNDLSKRTENQAASNDYFADQLSTIIHDYIKTSTVTVSVTTTGTATNQAGTGTGQLS